MPTVTDLGQTHRIQSIRVWPFLPPGHDERERMQQAEHQKELGEPLMENLEIFVGVSRDKADEVPFGSKGEDEGEDTESHHTRSDGQGRTTDVPSRAVIRRDSERPNWR